MSWGNKILIGFLTFVIGISSLVYIAMKQSNEVIDDNYYETELKYQDKIDASKNLTSLTEKLTVVNNANELSIQFPKEAVNNNPQGKIHLLSALQHSNDVTINLNVENAVQSINKNKLVKGIYFLKIDWMNNNIKYYHQQNINIQ
ncbi:MAG: FixH family protein [Bacteroidetes bacterium]|nr:FixH family protein [Bacteroidota bacterium]MBS1650260.1 FixH family protein [Bacteroidota bacterium]